MHSQFFLAVVFHVLLVNAGNFDVPTSRQITQSDSCTSASGILTSCIYGNPGFFALSTSEQARCLCYSNSVWTPSNFDTAVRSCIRSSPADSKYYLLETMENFCARAGDVPAPSLTSRLPLSIPNPTSTQTENQHVATTTMAMATAPQTSSITPARTLISYLSTSQLRDSTISSCISEQSPNVLSTLSPLSSETAAATTPQITMAHTSASHAMPTNTLKTSTSSSTNPFDANGTPGYRQPNISWSEKKSGACKVVIGGGGEGVARMVVVIGLVGMALGR